MKHPLLDELPGSSRTRLERYVALLRVWNLKVNLVSRANDADLWNRHVLDCLQLLQHIPRGVTEFVDLGSGGGFPGLVLAIAGGMHVHLVESDQRKAAFLREAARVTKAPATVHACRAETLKLERAPLVTARALAPLPRLLTMAAPLLKPDGFCLFLKGQRVGEELMLAKRNWQMSVTRLPTLYNKLGCILLIRDIERHEPGARTL